MSKLKIYTKDKLKFWVYANKLVVKIGIQYARYDIYTTANKRNFYSFKKQIVKHIETEDHMDFYDVLRIGSKNRIVGVAAYKPTEEE